MTDPWVLFTDGAHRGRTNESAYGAVLYDPEGQEVMTLYDCIGRESSPVAEWYGLMAGLCCALQAGAEFLLVNMDTQIIINQMNKKARVRAAHIIPIHQRVLSLVNQFGGVEFRWVPRAQNARADELCNMALDRRADGTKAG